MNWLTWIICIIILTTHHVCSLRLKKVISNTNHSDEKRSLNYPDLQSLDDNKVNRLQAGILQDDLNVDLARNTIQAEEEKEKTHLLKALNIDQSFTTTDGNMHDEENTFSELEAIDAKSEVNNAPDEKSKSSESSENLASLGFDLDEEDSERGNQGDAKKKLSNAQKRSKAQVHRANMKSKSNKARKRQQGEYPEFKLDSIGEDPTDALGGVVDYGVPKDSNDNGEGNNGNNYKDVDTEPFEHENYEQEDTHSNSESEQNSDSPKPHHHVGLRPQIGIHEKGDKRFNPLGGKYLLHRDELQRGIQPSQNVHMEDVRQIDKLQHELGVQKKLLGEENEDEDHQFDTADAEENTDDEYEGDNRYNDDDEDADDFPPDDDINDEEDDEKRHIVKQEQFENDDDQTLMKQKDKEETGKKKTLLVHKNNGVDEKLEIPDEMLAESKEHGNEGISTNDHMAAGAHEYHIYHNPQHRHKEIHTHSRGSYHTYAKHTENPCDNGGIFAPLGDTHVCICKERFMGPNCEEINYCHRHPCKHCGKCQVTKHWPHYRCECCQRYSGKHCEIRNPCEPNPCYNGGECTHDGHTPTCICKSKFKGRYCDEINKCRPNPCMNDGTCVERSGIGSFHCFCPNSWIGTICDKPSRCYDNPCFNGGTCREDGDKFKCICDVGFRGLTCLVKICLPNPCGNGGACVENGNDFHCVCPPWTKGPLCLDVSPCLLNPCKNGARCVDAYSGFRWNLATMQYYCLCQPPFHGPHCEHNPCLSCDIHAHCETDRCVCEEGYEGDGQVCTVIPEPCHPNPCYNGGTCIDEGHGFYHCLCRHMFKLPYCITPIFCSPNPCNGGQCVTLVYGYICENCPPGFVGKTCSEPDPCIPNPCHHGAKCKPSANGKNFTCECDKHKMYSGDLCEKCDCKPSNDPKIPSAYCGVNGNCICPESYEYQKNSGKCVAASTKACSAKPCHCDAQCFDLDTGTDAFRCQCPGHCYGDLCQHRRICFDLNPCKNGGSCIDVIIGNTYTCKCPPGISGQNCTVVAPPTKEVIISACVPNPCHNGGVCIRFGKTYDCKCLTRYTGPNCGIDKCKDCDEHAKCIAGECICHNGYIGNGYECVKECKTKCLSLEWCNNGYCDCINGYHHVKNLCVKIQDMVATTLAPTHHMITHRQHSTHAFVTHFTKPTVKTQSTKMRNRDKTSTKTKQPNTKKPSSNRPTTTTTATSISTMTPSGSKPPAPPPNLGPPEDQGSKKSIKTSNDRIAKVTLKLGQAKSLSVKPKSHEKKKNITKTETGSKRANLIKDSSEGQVYTMLVLSEKDDEDDDDAMVSKQLNRKHYRDNSKQSKKKDELHPTQTVNIFNEHMYNEQAHHAGLNKTSLKEEHAHHAGLNKTSLKEEHALKKGTFNLFQMAIREQLKATEASKLIKPTPTMHYKKKNLLSMKDSSVEKKNETLVLHDDDDVVLDKLEEGKVVKITQEGNKKPKVQIETAKEKSLEKNKGLSDGKKGIQHEQKKQYEAKQSPLPKKIRDDSKQKNSIDSIVDLQKSSANVKKTSHSIKNEKMLPMTHPEEKQSKLASHNMRIANQTINHNKMSKVNHTKVQNISQIIDKLGHLKLENNKLNASVVHRIGHHNIGLLAGSQLWNDTNYDTTDVISFDEDVPEDQRHHEMINMLKEYGENVNDEIFEISDDFTGSETNSHDDIFQQKHNKQKELKSEKRNLSKLQNSQKPIGL